MKSILSIVAALTLVPLVLDAQRIDASQPSCAKCTLTLTKVVTLGSINDETLPGVGMRGTGLVMDNKGQFYVTGLGSDQVVVYAPSGKFVRAFGRKGDGPGEFRQAISLAIDPFDTLYVTDVGHIAVYSPTSKFVRNIPTSLDGAMTSVVLPNKSVLIGFPGGYRGGSLRVATGAGRLQSFPRDSMMIDQCKICTMVLAKGAVENRVWSSWNARYALKQWSTNGQLERELSVVNSSWLNKSEAEWDLTPGLPPPPVVAALQEGKNRQLWVLGEIAAPNWTPFVRRDDQGGGRSGGRIAIGGAFAGPETLKRLVTVVDVIDLATNRLILSQRFPNRKFRMFAPGFIGEVREDANDIPVWDIFRVEIKKP